MSLRAPFAYQARSDIEPEPSNSNITSDRPLFAHALLEDEVHDACQASHAHVRAPRAPLRARTAACGVRGCARASGAFASSWLGQCVPWVNTGTGSVSGAATMAAGAQRACVHTRASSKPIFNYMRHNYLHAITMYALTILTRASSKPVFDYMRHNYTWHNSIRHNYLYTRASSKPIFNHMRHNYTCHNYIGHNYVDPCLFKARLHLYRP